MREELINSSFKGHLIIIMSNEASFVISLARKGDSE